MYKRSYSTTQEKADLSKIKWLASLIPQIQNEKQKYEAIIELGNKITDFNSKSKTKTISYKGGKIV